MLKQTSLSFLNRDNVLKTSISNLAWGDTPLKNVLPLIKSVGLDGVELAPTSIWPDILNVSVSEIKKLRKTLENYNLEVSGIQSLLFGFPELQIFSKESWPKLVAHLEHMFMIAENLGAGVAVFGSPRNRIKGKLTWEQASEVSCEFFSLLIPSLERHNLVLTLEPNAPEYGSDFLVNYKEVIELSKSIDSPQISVQIDTGCLWMVGDEPSAAFAEMKPFHIHISTPNLETVPGNLNFNDLLDQVSNSTYKGWLVIESLNRTPTNAIDSAKWLINELEKRI